ncbi:Putative dienelactone hydrolase, alpha/Beta hydrolase [Septoria linicola]|uniref:Dienelactone hydrolase, alpha/Beta hydrolase n=1 Tax=Septoria linicola TaxID=215465 RepID=A0A9Q9B2S2_9PEZI|nr:Putative dienelactone hydrolase, alpha/Beta hydrolase [Septoria linicola]
MSDKTIAHPTAACCLTGQIHEGEPKGHIETMLDVEVYVAEPTADKANGNVLLYFPDAFGHYTNSKLLMDGFAEAGYLVLGPDYFRGDPVQKHRKDPSNPNENPDFDLQGWVVEHRAFADPWVPRWIEAVKSRYGKTDTKFVCTGYCFGAPYILDQLSDKGICCAGAFAHPASLKESHFENAARPIFLSCSEIDHTFPKDLRRRAIDILEERQTRYQVQLFQGVSHGFAVKGDMSDRWQRYAKDASFEGILGWFDLWSDSKR